MITSRHLSTSSVKVFVYVFGKVFVDVFRESLCLRVRESLCLRVATRAKPFHMPEPAGTRPEGNMPVIYEVLSHHTELSPIAY